jgi:hypothetical protein
MPSRFCGAGFRVEAMVRRSIMWFAEATGFPVFVVL